MSCSQITGSPQEATASLVSLRSKGISGRSASSLGSGQISGRGLIRDKGSHSPSKTAANEGNHLKSPPNTSNLMKQGFFLKSTIRFLELLGAERRAELPTAPGLQEQLAFPVPEKATPFSCELSSSRARLPCRLPIPSGATASVAPHRSHIQGSDQASL